MPADFKEELKDVRDFILETRNSPEIFRSYHWMISTNDHWRFADSSAMLGGPFDMSERMTKPAQFQLVSDALMRLLAMPYIYAANIVPASQTLDALEIGGLFAPVDSYRLLTAVAGGRRLSETSGWSLKLVFIGLMQTDPFLQANAEKLVATKPLLGQGLHSKRLSGTGFS